GSAPRTARAAVRRRRCPGRRPRMSRRSPRCPRRRPGRARAPEFRSRLRAARSRARTAWTPPASTRSDIIRRQHAGVTSRKRPVAAASKCQCARCVRRIGPKDSRYSCTRAAMQDRTHAALRFHLHGGSTLMALAVAAAIAAATIGCSQEGPLTDQEMEQLRAFMLPAEGPPADTSNAFADNRAAAGLGKRLYFDGGYSGGLGPYNRKDVNGALGAQ